MIIGIVIGTSVTERSNTTGKYAGNTQVILQGATLDGVSIRESPQYLPDRSHRSGTAGHDVAHPHQSPVRASSKDSSHKTYLETDWHFDNPQLGYSAIRECFVVSR